MANSFFHENYVAHPMAHSNQPPRHEYSWDTGRPHRFAATIDRQPSYPSPSSVNRFITQHYWGYSAGPKRALEYRVEHPQRKSCLVDNFEIDVDFAETYGKEFSMLNALQPFNVHYAADSAVTVSSPSRL